MALFNKKNLGKVNKYDITEDDMIDDLKGFPVGIVVRMMEEQEKQGNKPDVKAFQRHIIAGKFNSGFTWNETEAGEGFWYDVILTKDFKLFFEKYPEYKRYN